MAIQSSYTQVAEQVINLNNNVVGLLSKINNLVTSNDPSVTVNITDESGVVRQFTLPSFGYLKSEIDRLNNNLNSMYSINDAGALIQPSNGTKFKKVVTVDLNREPNDISNLGIPTTFKTQKNWFFDGLLNPQIFIELDLSGQIENNVRKVLCRRYIPVFESLNTGSLTPSGQSALNSFNTLFRNKSGFTLDEYEQWHRQTPGVVNPVTPNYDEQMFDLEPNTLEFDGLFTVLRIEEDTLNRKLWYHVNTLNYVRNRNVNGELIQETKQLGVNDELIINTPISVTRYKILEISTAASNPRLRFERIEGFEPIPAGVGTLKIYSPVLYNKKVRISVGYSENNVVFVRPLNMENYILSKNWSPGIGYFTNDLRDVDSGLSMEQFYIDTVNDYGRVLAELVSAKTPNSLGATPNMVTLAPENFQVVQANKHLTDTPDANLIKNKHNQQKTLKSEINQLLDAISEKNKQLKVQRFTSAAERKQYTNELENLINQKNSKTKLLSSLTTEILQLSNAPTSKTEPIFRVRGFWSIPDAVITNSTKPQEIVQFRIAYKYLSKDGKELPVETSKLADATSGPKTAAFSNWIEFKTDVRKRIYDASTGKYSWAVEDVSDADTTNINQLDIPIKYGERVAVRIKSISEVGWPDSPIESDWSNELTVEFPDSLNNVVNDNDAIQKEALKEDLRVAVQNDLAALGLNDHLSEQTTVNNVTYLHSTDRILSGFRDENGIVLDLLNYLTRLENRIKSLEEIVKRIKGELEVIVFRNSEQSIVKNGTTLTFNLECEDYLDVFTAAGVPTGRVYQNNIYVIKEFLLKLKNKSADSPLGLLSNKNYDTQSGFYSNFAPQVFWVNQEDELIVDNSSGQTRTQVDNQFIWATNFDGVQGSRRRTAISANIGNEFVRRSRQLSITNPLGLPANLRGRANSITEVLSSNQYNVGYIENTILSFVGNNNSILEPVKWVDINESVVSTSKLLSTVHPIVQSLDKIQETNADKVKSLSGGEQNDINIPINIYFKMNACDTTKTGLNFQYVNLNNVTTTVKHSRKVKFFLENENDNTPFTFTIVFNLNRAKIATNTRGGGANGQRARGN